MIKARRHAPDSQNFSESESAAGPVPIVCFGRPRQPPATYCLLLIFRSYFDFNIVEDALYRHGKFTNNRLDICQIRKNL